MLAALPNVVAKHSGLGMPVLGLGPMRTRKDTFRDAIAPLVTHLDQAFGPDRTFWSSNYPMDKPTISLPDTVWVTTLSTGICRVVAHAVTRAT